ncbi:hypothetical protein ACTI_44450 [Actinoplanes sp. OR16]|uniref:hypothetical protein n=1 Tax=Actinoplanes sp. OR16 TaxID=946334 RepID=UPI000F7120CC|nr:hypothetical protein [Actinoplanes sp. OR16]BBH67760.1 hypothetical protein ACTI_44450 [Actinoplanes sp. OR16]
MRRLHLSLVILALVLLMPGRAHAASSWPPVSVCTEVEFTGGSVQRSPMQDSYVITGYVRACPGADDPQARWTVARYETGGLGVVSRQMPYGVPGERGYRFLYKRYAAAGTWAACVVNDVRPTEADPLLGTANRVACVGPDPDPPPSDYPVLSTPLVPISIDDPRFDGVLVVGETAAPRPVCSGCV